MHALVAISLVLLAMVIAVNRKVNITLTVLFGVILTSLLFGRITLIPSDALETLKQPTTISLMLLVYFVFFLNNYLSGIGAMKKMISSLENIVTDQKVIISMIPALIGLLPSPSGAVLSAPFADEIGVKTDLPKERRLLVNYWFRHISEYVNPIYPGVLLATTLLGLSFYQFFKANVPVMMFYVALGVFLYVLPVKSVKTPKRKISGADVRNIINGTGPIFVAVILPVTLKIDLAVSLFIAIICAVLLNLKDKVDVRKISRQSLKLDLILLVYFVLLFKTILEKSDAAKMMSESLMQLGAPTPLLLMIIPATVGFLTGLTVGFVGLTFPILMPFLVPGGVPNMPYITLAYVSGYLGILASPMHLCLTVTRKYFNVEQNEVYRILLRPILLVLAWTLVYVFLL